MARTEWSRCSVCWPSWESSLYEAIIFIPGHLGQVHSSLSALIRSVLCTIAIPKVLYVSLLHTNTPSKLHICPLHPGLTYTCSPRGCLGVSPIQGAPVSQVRSEYHTTSEIRDFPTTKSTSLRYAQGILPPSSTQTRLKKTRHQVKCPCPTSTNAPTAHAQFHSTPLHSQPPPGPHRLGIPKYPKYPTHQTTHLGNHLPSPPFSTTHRKSGPHPPSHKRIMLRQHE